MKTFSKEAAEILEFCRNQFEIAKNKRGIQNSNTYDLVTIGEEIGFAAVITFIEVNCTTNDESQREN